MKFKEATIITKMLKPIPMLLEENNETRPKLKNDKTECNK